MKKKKKKKLGVSPLRTCSESNKEEEEEEVGGFTARAARSTAGPSTAICFLVLTGQDQGVSRY
jgi:hypothetical protein